ncbi:divergent polysaccharide deacetylase family protein [Thalassospira sp. TSL5-1]|uniref:divergent polysaccharide deacetylase family protein n=1 Tax=Thalassospira sp. TSL5-1 TaxID=1544451 RepID=UPI00093D83D4|nr:divergent polysaccharide deacetylase family protein [Thalassospira sp. TSL5-1]
MLSAPDAEDVPFTELPLDEQLRRLPLRPPTRRWRLSKFLLVVLYLLPFGIISLAAVPLLDPETGWHLFHAGSPRVTQAIPGTERELQDEIAKGVLDIEARNRAEEEARRKNGNEAGNETEGDVPPGTADIASGQNGDGSQGMGQTGAASEAGSSTGPSPEELAALAEEGGFDEKIEPDPLRPAPIPGMDEEGSFGRIPRIAEDGRTPAKVYARPFTLEPEQPYVAVIVTGLGLNEDRTTKAIEDLPLNISLALSPYADNLPKIVARARQMGHEVFLQLPMEPDDFPLSDPGPRALMTTLPEGENLVRLEWLLARFPGYAGVVGHLGSKFANLDSAIRPVIDFLDKTGLMYVDGSNTGMVSLAAQLAANAGEPNAIVDFNIDTVPSRRAIDAQLAALVNKAKTEGYAIGLAQSYPVTISRLRNWAQRLERQGVKLAPVTALADKQVKPQSAEEADAAQRKNMSDENARKGDAPSTNTDASENTIEGN